MRPGDRVISTTWSQKTGELGKVSKVTALVRWDGEERFERVYREGLRLETAEDVADRERDAAMKAWRGRKPKTELASVTYSRFGFHAHESGAEVGHCKEPADMRAAAAELHALADWFEQKPKETK